MEDRINPFSDDYHEDEAESSEENSYDVTEHLSVEDVSLQEPEIKLNSDSVAEYLLQKKFILAALELHMELLEVGKEVPRLRNYFSNPANFEQQGNGSFFEAPSNLYRTGSISTFDSLDLTHYSDDGMQQDDRVAVLEFELRKANETIKSLRMSLTGTLDDDSFLKKDVENMNQSSVLMNQDFGDSGNGDTEMNPLVKRALNYLVNEYLLQNDYKLSSITLADEIEDQDFEDWDDVGLNMPKPPNLLKLFNDYASHTFLARKSCDASVETEESFAEMERELVSLRNECENLKHKNEELRQVAVQLEEQLSKPPKTPLVTSRNESESPSNIESKDSERNSEHTENRCSISLASDDSKAGFVTGKPPPQRMSTKFWEYIFFFWRESGTQNNWLSSEVTKIAADTDQLVSTLSISLPRILQTINPEQREQAVPLLLSASAMQKDVVTRNTLLHNLFNLIDKPERNQRSVILSGCIAYARLIGPMQTEEDLLPQFWEQIGHKYTERRHLVAEACGVIAPFLRPEMCSSLLLSILQQMEQEESVEKVREAIVRSLAVIFSLLTDDDKYTLVFAIVCKFLKDKSSSIQLSARGYLLPTFACWSRQIGRLSDHLFDHFLTDIESCVSDSGNKTQFNSQGFIVCLENLSALVPLIFADILLNAPQQSEGDESITYTPTVKFDDESYKMGMVIEEEKDFHDFYNRFCSCVTSTDVANWQPLSTFIFNFIPRLLKVVQNIQLHENECVHALCQFFSSMVILFGTEFTESHLKVKRSELFRMDGEDLTRQISLESTPFTSAAVAVYSCGILANLPGQEANSELSKFLSDTLVSLATCHAPLTSLEVALVEIRQKDLNFHQVLLDVLWDSIGHPSAFVREATALLFKVMAMDQVSDKDLTTRVLPALLTLSKDRDERVQTSTLPAFGALIECSHSNQDIIDRVVAQFSAFMAPSESSIPHHSMNVEMVKTMGEVTPKADPRFCNEFVLPHLAAIAARNNQESNKTKRSDIALEMLQAFTNISFCYINDNLLQSAFIPGLRCLLQDMEKLYPEHVPQIEKLIKEIEQKLEHRTPVSVPESPAYGAAETSTPKTPKSRFYNKLF